MIEPRYHRLPLGAIRPAGILGGLLDKQRRGLTGAMPDIFPDVGPRSAWLGGDGESWERGPYYLDGLVPLAFLTDDPALLERVGCWMDALFSSQREDGFFGPSANDDWWPRFVALKAVVQYAGATGSCRAQSFLVRFCDHMIAAIGQRPPSFWGHARGLEAFPAVLDVARLTGDDRYLDLLGTLAGLTFPWSAFFRDFPYPEPTTRYLNRTLFLALKPVLAVLDRLEKTRGKPRQKTREEIERGNRKGANIRYLTTHGVNLAMAVKYPVYESFLAGSADADILLGALDVLLGRHGTATGVFSSDEHLDGPDPAKGIELCTVVELMHSLEEGLVLTGDVRIADRLERIAWNALPATFTHDLCAHQYLQQTDQPEATVRRRGFYDAGPRSTTFGIAPNFGCCAANLHQGFPKFAAAAVLAQEAGIAIFLIAAGTYDCGFAVGSATIGITTGYPFSDRAVITVVACNVAGKSLAIRRPFGAPATVNGGPASDAGGMILLSRDMKAGDVFELAFAFAVETAVNADGTASVLRGPVLYCHKLDAIELPLGGTAPFHDRAFVPREAKRHLLCTKAGKAVVLGVRMPDHDPDFYQNDGGIDVAAIDEETQTRVALGLVPYGTATLRYTHFKTLEDA